MALAPHEQCPVSTQNFVSLECGIYATMYAKCKWREAFNQNLCVFCENQLKKNFISPSWETAPNVSEKSLFNLPSYPIA